MLVNLIKKHALYDSSKIAIKAGKGILTYQQLEDLSSSLSNSLVNQGVNKGSFVILFADRSIHTIIGMYAIMKIGACYVPLEPEDYADNIDKPLSIFDGCFILSPLSYKDKLKRIASFTKIIIEEELNKSNELRENNVFDKNLKSTEPVYSVLTSGTSNKGAKAVIVTTNNLLSYINNIRNYLNISKALNYAYVSSFSADLGNTSLYLSLVTGGSLHILDNITRKDPSYFRKYIEENNIEVIKITPTHFEAIYSEFYSYIPLSLKYIIFGGEKLSITLVKSIMQSGFKGEIFNHYGPAETTIGVACYKVNLEELEQLNATSVPIGKPLGENYFFLLDKKGNYQNNKQGELYIVGTHVSSGYYKRDELNKEAFINNKFNYRGHNSAYKTGDLVKLLENGCYEFVSRNDRSFKTKGFLVDPVSLENKVKSIPNIKLISFNKLIINKFEKTVLFIVLKDYINKEETIQHIKTLCQTEFPIYMHPNLIIPVNDIPYTSNGKVDKNELGTIAYNYVNAQSHVVKNPEDNYDSIKTICIELWKHYLLKGYISEEDNFFELGGDSILVIQLVSSLQTKGIKVYAQMLFEKPKFKDFLDAIYNYENKNELKSLPQKKKKEYNLSPIQNWFFDKKLFNVNYWHQALAFEVLNPLNLSLIKKTLTTLISTHTILNTKFLKVNNKWLVEIGSATIDQTFQYFKLRISERENFAQVIKEQVNLACKEIAIEKGNLFKCLLISNNTQNQLIFIAHHLIIDGISWRILIDDFSRIYHHYFIKQELYLPKVETDFWDWSKTINSLYKSKGFIYDHNFWLKNLNNWYDEYKDKYFLPTDKKSKVNIEADIKTYWLHYDNEDTEEILKFLSKEHLQLQNFILAIFLFYIKNTLSHDVFCIDIETHGREHVLNKDVARSMGWFTAMYPYVFDFSAMRNVIEAARHVQALLLNIPNNGIYFGALYNNKQKLNRDEDKLDIIKPDLCFNYLGQFNTQGNEILNWKPSNIHIGNIRDGNNSFLYKIKLTARHINGQLSLDLSCSKRLYDNDKMLSIMGSINEFIQKVANTSRAYNHLYVENKGNSGLLLYVPDYFKKEKLFSAKATKDPKAVFVTGATGFLGVYILKQLIDDTSATIYCLIRGEDEDGALERLRLIIQWYFPELDYKLIQTRLKVLAGDVASPDFGIHEEKYLELAREVDLIFHCAADIRLFGQEKDFFKTNVTGTENVIRLAETFRPKEIHHISTLGVAGRAKNSKEMIFSEANLYYGQEFLNPYEKSKFESEKILQSYKHKGGIVFIYRVGNISANSVNGRFQRNISSNRIMQTLKGYIKSGLAPDLPNENIYFSYVDIVALGVVRVALSPKTNCDTFHIENTQAINHNMIVNMLNKRGYDIKIQVVPNYILELQSNENNYDKETKIAINWTLRTINYPRNVTFCSNKTKKILDELNVIFIEPSEEWLDKMLEHCYSVNYITRPMSSS